MANGQQVTHKVNFDDGGSLDDFAKKFNQTFKQIGEGTIKQDEAIRQLGEAFQQYNKDLGDTVKQGAKAAEQTERLTNRQKLLASTQEEFNKTIEDGLGPWGKYLNILKDGVTKYSDNVKQARRLKEELKDQIRLGDTDAKSKQKTISLLNKASRASTIFRVALTGIGAAIAILAVGFSRNQKLMDQFSVTLAGVKAVVNSVLNSFGDLAGAIVNIVTLDFAAAWDDIKNAVKGVTVELVENVQAAADAERSLQALRNQQINYALSLSASRDELFELSQVISDGNATYEERIAAVNRAAEIERQFAAERQAIAEQQLRANIKSSLSQEDFNQKIRDLENEADTFETTAEKAAFLAAQVQALSTEDLSPERLNEVAQQIVEIQGLQLESSQLELDSQREIESIEEERREAYRKFAEERKKAEEDLAKFRQGIQKRLQDIELSNLEGEARIEFERKIANEEINELERVAREKFKAVKKEFELEEEFQELRENLANETERQISEYRLSEARRRIADEQEFAELQLQQINEVAEDGLTLEESRQIELLEIRREGLKKLRAVAVEEFGEGSLEALRIDVEIGNIDQQSADDAAKTAQRLINERLEALDKTQEIRLAEVDLIKDRANEELTLEQNKERQRLSILVDGLQKRREILVEQFGGEDAPEIQLLDLELDKLQQQINDIDSIKLDPLEKIKQKLLDAFNLSPEDAQVITDQLNNIVQNIFAGFDALRQARLAENEATIERIESNIEELQSKLDIEEEREREGFANSAQELRDSLEEQNKARAKAEEERLNIERKAARQRLVQESAQQISSLSLAAARLLATEASKGIIGLVLAASGIATIFSIISRAKAQAVEFSSAPEFREGGSIVNGLLLGPSHEGGGIPAVYTDNQGRSRAVSLEGNEFVVNRNDAAKNMPLLEAINSGVDQDGLRRVLMEGVTLEGINFNSGIQKLMGNGGREIVLKNGVDGDAELLRMLGVKLDSLKNEVSTREEFFSHGNKIYKVDRSSSVPRFVPVNG